METGAQAFEEEYGIVVQLNIAGSNTLAQQIQVTALADVFLSADPLWMDVLEKSGHVDPDLRKVLFSNRLALIARIDADRPFLREFSSLPDLASAADRGDFRHLAIGQPEGVPAGRYARSYLSLVPSGNTTVWDAVEDRVVPTQDVRAALALVQSDPEVLGIVYTTDAISAPQVRVVYGFPSLSVVPIEYHAAILATAPHPETALRFFEFLDSPRFEEIVQKYGFIPR